MAFTLNHFSFSAKTISGFLFFCFVFAGCKNFTTNEISEGTIEYEISYPNPSEITMSMDLMPKTLTYKFSEHKTCSEISAGLGALKTLVLTDFEKKTIIQTLNLLGKKYKVEFSKAALDSMINAEPQIKMEASNETKKIAGYNCKKVNCSLRDVSGAIFNYEIYYTQDIKSPHLNWFSMYKDIDGMLMEYRIKRYGINMHFKAKSVSPEGADDNAFKLEGEYKDIPASEMEGYFKMY